MRPVPSIPSFALIGQPNEGKTTVMATLAEDDQAAISPEPGTTRTCRRYAVQVDGSEILVFFDTPGFENSEAVLAWFHEHADAADPVAAFLAARDTSRFRPEREILQPLSEGAAIIYVADASRPVRPVDHWELEILRLTGARRIGVINSKEGCGEYLEEWRRVMARDFNHIHEFNGHRATFQDRLKLLEAARAVIQEWEGPMDRSIRVLREEWEGRLREVAGLIIHELRALMELREHETIQNPGDEGRASEQAKVRLMDAVRRGELRFRKQARAIFHHSNERWAVNDLLEQDLFSQEVWRVLGLARWQLALAGAVIGAIIGAVVDAHVAFASMGLATMVGAAAGALSGWLSAEKAVDIQMPKMKIWGPISLPGGRIGGRQAEASVTPQSNLLWIVLDRSLLYIRLCASWAHGRREATVTPVKEEEGKLGFTAGWSRQERGKVIDFVGHLRRSRRDQEKLDHAERALREMLVVKLRDVAQGVDDPQ